MDGNTELLNYVYQNSQMGVDTIGQLVKIAKDSDFRNHLQSQWNEYASINEAALHKLKTRGHEEKGIGSMAKIATYMSIGMKTMADQSPSHISEMLIQGSTMGIIDVTKNRKKYEDADKDILDLADRLLKTEQNNIEQTKSFLC